MRSFSHFIPGAALALLMLGAATAAAETPITINGGVGQWFFADDRTLADHATPWVSLEYAFSDQWAGELFYAEDETELLDSLPTDISSWQLNMLYYGGSYSGEGNRIRPYFVVGGGEIDIDAGNFESRETTFNYGAGLRWMLTPRFGARMEAKMLHSLDEHQNDVLVTAGLNYYFGDVGSGRPLTETSAPAQVAEASPVDSDGDGVYDDQDQCPGTAMGIRVDASGCPLPVARIASIKLKVNFGFDSDEVQERYFEDVDELAKFLQRFEDVHLEVEGHTDNVGPDDYNQQLSERRAQAVIDLLVNQHGISAGRLEARGYGETQPVASNDTAEGRSENRRVMATLEVEYSDQ